MFGRSPFRAARKPAAEPPGPRRVVVEAGGLTVAVDIRSDRRARTLRLRVPLAGDPVLTAPSGVDRRAVDRFLEEQRGWLGETLSRRPRPITIADGALLPLRGVPHRIVHLGERRGAAVAATADAGDPVIAVRGDPAHLTRRVTDWLRKEARADITAAVGRHAGRIGRTPRSIQLRDTVSRWGSCASTGALSFSWRLVLAPPHVLDYVAAHEVAHLVHMNHSAEFWRLVAELFPNHAAARAWLRREGALLHAVGAG